MKRCTQRLATMVVLVALSNLSAQSQEHMIARVKLANGRTVEGVITGGLLIKSKTVEEQVGDATEYTAAYFFVPGANIVSIDARGIRAAPGKGFFMVVATTEGAPPVDTAVTETAFKDLKKFGASNFVSPQANGINVFKGVIIPRPESRTRKFSPEDELRIAQVFHGERAVRTLKRAIEEEKALRDAYEAEAQQGTDPAVTWRGELLGTLLIEDEKAQLTRALTVETPKGAVKVGVKDLARVH